MELIIAPHWKTFLQDEFNQPYFEQLATFVEREYAEQTVFPPAELIFNAFNLCPLNNIKVVILGQDPYHGDGQAHGLSFSVPDGVKPPPSLKNIFKELASDLGCPIPLSGNLERWAAQGVLLLNATLTVRAHQAGSHQKRGWETFTDGVIQKVSESCKNVVFLLWGAYAGKKESLIDPSKHLILKSVHPSPLSAYGGFFGCRHFSQANDYLRACGRGEVAW